MKALAVVGCIFGAAGFLLATYSAVAPSKAHRKPPVAEQGRTLRIVDSDEAKAQAPAEGGCCKPKPEEAKKSHDCKMGCEK